jgi:hypothetical protein
VETEAADRIRTEKSGVGMTLGVVTFLVGVALLLLTFKLAYDLFSVPPVSQLSMTKEGSVDLGKSGGNIVNIVFRVILLIVMGLMGSLIANRGISLFTGSTSRRHRE